MKKKRNTGRKKIDIYQKSFSFTHRYNKEKFAFERLKSLKSNFALKINNRLILSAIVFSSLFLAVTIKMIEINLLYTEKGNYFVEILIPDSFQGEVIEAWTGNCERDYVGLDNKLNKSEPETAGGFYATKIAIFEHLEERKRQAAFVSLRLISGYDIPLGVVFVRECVREALKKKPLFRGTSEKELNEFLSQKYPKHFKLYSESRVLKERKRQRKLGEYL